MISNYHQWLSEIMSGNYFDHVYMIEMRKEQKKWYFLDSSLNETIHKIYWTPSIKSAHIFITEQAVEEFKSNYISPRKVSIIRTPALDKILTFSI